jgi:hypothetical protein
MSALPGIGSATAQRVIERMAEAADPIAALAGIPTPPRAGDDCAARDTPDPTSKGKTPLFS